MATFYLPSSTTGYSTDNDAVKFRIKVTENYSSANGKRLYCQLIAYRTNTGYTTDGAGSATWYLDGTQKSSVSWEYGDKPITGPSGTTMSSVYITLADSATTAKITVKFSLPNTSAGTNTNGGTVTLTKYTISYDANGGTGAPSSQTGCYKNTVTLSSTKPSRTGYTFLGWNTSSTATSSSHSAGGKLTVTSNVKLYAVWSANKYTLTLNANGGSPSTQTLQLTYGSTNYYGVNAWLPTRMGYAFLGWYTSASGGTQVYDATGACTNEGTYWKNNKCVYAGNYTLFAHWDMTANCYVKNSGVYKMAMVYVKENGTYKNVSVSIKENGAYKTCGT